MRLFIKTSLALVLSCLCLQAMDDDKLFSRKRKFDDIAKSWVEDCYKECMDNPRLSHPLLCIFIERNQFDKVEFFVKNMQLDIYGLSRSLGFNLDKSMISASGVMMKFLLCFGAKKSVYLDSRLHELLVPRMISYSFNWNADYDYNTIKRTNDVLCAIYKSYNERAYQETWESEAQITKAPKYYQRFRAFDVECMQDDREWARVILFIRLWEIIRSEKIRENLFDTTYQAIREAGLVSDFEDKIVRVKDKDAYDYYARKFIPLCKNLILSLKKQILDDVTFVYQ